MKELHFSTYVDYETIATCSHVYIRTHTRTCTKQTPRSLLSSLALFSSSSSSSSSTAAAAAAVSFVTVECETTQKAIKHVFAHTHLKILLQPIPRSIPRPILSILSSLSSSAMEMDNQLHIEGMMLLVVLLMLLLLLFCVCVWLCLSTKQHFYRCVINAFSNYNERRLLLYFSSSRFRWRKKETRCRSMTHCLLHLHLTGISSGKNAIHAVCVDASSPSLTAGCGSSFF